MKRCTELKDGKVVLTDYGNHIYCSSTATAEVLYEYEEIIEKLKDNLTEDKFKEFLEYDSIKKTLAENEAHIQKLYLLVDELEHYISELENN